MSYTPAMQSPAAPHVGPYTWDDFINLEDDDRRELIDGELVEVEVPNLPHERIVGTLVYHLIAWTRAGGGGCVLASGFKVRISERRGVMPDIQYYRRENVVPKQEYKGAVTSKPDLAVEIISPSSRRYDRVTKLNWYASRGVPEYWIVDPEARTLERLVLGDAGYTIAASLAEDGVLRPPSFSGLEIPLAELWEEATASPPLT
jgi:Uma2 family endonuclease